TEYAPVPGNSTAGAGSGFVGVGGPQVGAAAGALDLGSTGPGAGATAPGAELTSRFDCVGNPPRQTEDPLSPPCVPSFHGANGGATAAGVSATEIRVIAYLDGRRSIANGG